jgi:hypothetical protein
MNGQEGQTVTDVVTTELRDGIAGLLTRFCRCLDEGDGAGVAALFTDDARVDTPHFQLAGRNQIESWFSGRAEAKLSLHSWSNLRIEAIGPERFRVASNMINAAGARPMSQPPARIAFAIARDEIVLRAGTPLFAARALEILFDTGATPAEAQA